MKNQHGLVKWQEYSVANARKMILMKLKLVMKHKAQTHSSHMKNQ